MPTITIDDRPVRYDRAGAGSAPPVLLVHGFTGGRGDFAEVLPLLAEDRVAIAMDLPGHGGSPGPDDPAAYNLSAVAAWILRFADEVGLDDVHLLGHSLGGLAVQRAAAVASQRLRSLVLSATGLGALREEQADRVVRIAVAARDDGPEAALAASTDGQPMGEQERDAALDRFRNLNPAAVVGGAQGLISALPLGAFLRGIDVPVLVVHGEHDPRWLPSEQALLARTVAGAVHVVVPGAGHSPQRENTAEWAAVVRAFLRRVDGTADGSHDRF
jgi:pimeloyl-ACP methyl ester carboxylesterase